MLRLRRGVVVGVDPLEVEIEGERRRAWADVALVGEVLEGDEVVVNIAALDLGLGSGGYDIVHVNLTRGLDADAPPDVHVMKLNYTPLQHAVDPVEPEAEDDQAAERPMPVLVIGLHGQLAPALWAASEARPGIRIGFVQTPGGALPATLSGDVRKLQERGLLAGHIAAGPVHGAQHEAISVAGALDAAARTLGWDACVAGPGPGILGSASRLGHGGMAALDTAHAALALGLPTLLAPRLSGGDTRPRHRGLSHHSRTVLELLLGTVRVPVPEAATDGWPLGGDGNPATGEEALAELIEMTKDRHDLSVHMIDLEGYGASGLPRSTMGRDLSEDPLFFAAGLASGAALAEAAQKSDKERV
jgi:hypothetical protein